MILSHVGNDSKVKTKNSSGTINYPAHEATAEVMLARMPATELERRAEPSFQIRVPESSRF
jgi:hypothetical protein